MFEIDSRLFFNKNQIRVKLTQCIQQWLKFKYPKQESNLPIVLTVSTFVTIRIQIILKRIFNSLAYFFLVVFFAESRSVLNLVVFLLNDVSSRDTANGLPRSVSLTLINNWEDIFTRFFLIAGVPFTSISLKTSRVSLFSYIINNTRGVSRPWGSGKVLASWGESRRCWRD